MNPLSDWPPTGNNDKEGETGTPFNSPDTTSRSQRMEPGEIRTGDFSMDGLAIDIDAKTPEIKHLTEDSEATGQIPEITITIRQNLFPIEEAVDNGRPIKDSDLRQFDEYLESLKNMPDSVQEICTLYKNLVSEMLKDPDTRIEYGEGEPLHITEAKLKKIAQKINQNIDFGLDISSELVNEYDAALVDAKRINNSAVNRLNFENDLLKYRIHQSGAKIVRQNNRQGADQDPRTTSNENNYADVDILPPGRQRQGTHIPQRPSDAIIDLDHERNAAGPVVVDSTFNRQTRLDSEIYNETQEQEFQRLSKDLGDLLSQLTDNLSKLNQQDREQIAELLNKINGSEEAPKEISDVEFLRFIKFLRDKINDPEFAPDVTIDIKDTLNYVARRIKNIINYEDQEKMGMGLILQNEAVYSKQFGDTRGEYERDKKQMTEELAALHLDLENPQGPEPIQYKVATLKKIHSKIKAFVWKEGDILLKEISLLRELAIKKREELEQKETELRKARSELKQLTGGAHAGQNNQGIIRLSKTIQSLEAEIDGMENTLGAIEIERKNRLGVLNGIKTKAAKINTQEMKMIECNTLEDTSRLVEESMTDYKEVKELIEHKDKHHDEKHGHGDHEHHHTTLGDKMKAWGLVGGGLFSGLFVIFAQQLYKTIRGEKGGGGGGGSHGSHGGGHGGGGGHH